MCFMWDEHRQIPDNFIKNRVERTEGVVRRTVSVHTYHRKSANINLFNLKHQELTRPRFPKFKNSETTLR